MLLRGYLVPSAQANTGRPRMQFSLNQIEIVIEEGALDAMRAHRQAGCFSKEAGGQLFARINKTGWTIAEATGPRPSDKRSRFGFVPDRAAEQVEIADRFRLGLHYVGDWHTHPERRPKPSGTDMESIRSTVRSSRHELPWFLMLILGNDDRVDSFWLSAHLKDGSYEVLNSVRRSIRFI